eukprot:TRINITY_DN1162_c0_g2_i1.p1 TRINITY_DN1162_c0_g2~~TRINITY_DN1162_c0_g2_i1.p1  ORF type:complete len:350 (-),score=83.50 TRINITY_DN1162_c0_g2_i1:35-1084(-)
MEDIDQQNINILIQFLNDRNMPLNQKLQYIKESEQAKEWLSNLALYVQNYATRRNLTYENIISSNNNTPINFISNDNPPPFSPTNGGEFPIFPSLDSNNQSFMEDTTFEDTPKDDNNNTNNNHNILPPQIGGKHLPLRPQNRDERDKFVDKKYENSLDFLDYVVENVDNLLAPYNIIEENVEMFKEFVSALEIENKYEAIKSEIELCAKNSSKHLLYSAIESIKMGYYFSFLKIEAFENKENSYIEYIKEKTNTEYGDNTMRRYMKLYAIYCRMSLFILAINEDYPPSWFYEKNGTYLLEILRFNGSKKRSISDKKLPDKIEKSLPPIDDKLMDAHNQKKPSNKRKNIN